jgi:hypothetical protein
MRTYLMDFTYDADEYAEHHPYDNLKDDLLHEDDYDEEVVDE